MKERSRRVIETGVGVGAMAVLMTVSFFAFKRNIRHEIGTRDGWVCQKPGCDDGTGIAKSFDNGYMQYISHIKTHDKKHPDYNKPETGRAHCIQCEIDFQPKIWYVSVSLNTASGLGMAPRDSQRSTGSSRTPAMT